MTHAPAAMIEPGSPIRQSISLETEQILKCALKTDRGGMLGCDGGKAPLGNIQTHDHDVRCLFVENRHVDEGRIAPKGEKHPTPFGDLFRNASPSPRIDNHARPRSVCLDVLASLDGPEQGRSVLCNHALSQEPRDMLEPGDKVWREVETRCKDERQMREQR